MPEPNHAAAPSSSGAGERGGRGGGGGNALTAAAATTTTTTTMAEGRQENDDDDVVAVLPGYAIPNVSSLLPLYSNSDQVSSSSSAASIRHVEGHLKKNFNWPLKSK